MLLDSAGQNLSTKRDEHQEKGQSGADNALVVLSLISSEREGC